MSDQNRRDVTAAGVAAAALAVTSGALAQPAVPASQGDVKTGFYERNGVRIRYQETGKGFPLLAIPGGGLNSRIGAWPTAVINCMEHFKNDFRVITMDQRNANGGESTGPIPASDPWGAFADDQLGLMDHLGVRQFLFFGNCIGGPFGMKLMGRAPDRIAGAVLSQPAGHRPEKPNVLWDSGLAWAPDFRARRPDVTMPAIEAYLTALYRARPDFVYSVPREFTRTCRPPILVLPDDADPHPIQVSIDIASLAPNADTNVYPWVNPPELKARTIERVRRFYKTHQKV